MTLVSRRSYLRTSLAAVAAAGRPAPGREPQGRGIQLALALGPGQHSRFRLAVQMGVNHAIATVTGALAKVPRSQYAETLAQIKADFEAHGLKVAGVESSPVPSEKIKLGLPGRDEEIENYLAAIEALSRVGIPMICWNFMAGLGWYRTRTDVKERGGALTSEFNNADALRQGLTEWGEVSEERMWDNITYFLKAVIPAAEKHGIRMALHPDDPPIPKLRGIARIAISAANFRRIMNIVPSPVNGVTFCQANFKAMGEDIYSLAREWCREGKIFFVHFRDIEGQGEYFRETFHDNGPTDMVKMLQIYHDAGFRGPMRPDHAPTMEGESNDNPGYAMLGKILAIGYMKGIMRARGIPYE
jgi:mannonate dehydratase